MANCRTNLIGIQLVYCEAGVKREVWVDLGKVHALAWCHEEVKAKPGGEGGTGKLPSANKPGRCPDDTLTMTATATAAGTEVPVCWWNGSVWVCGDEA